MGTTTPVSGQIALSDVNVQVAEVVGASWNNPHQIGLDWVKGATKTTVGGSVNVVSDLNSVHDKDYYSNNMRGNCNNSNVGNCNCNCGNKNCTNCTNCNAINCADCDAGVNYLQPNCNCNCTYNCNVNSVSYNCDCDCFVCNCW
jgi:hypothetical protein